MVMSFKAPSSHVGAWSRSRIKGAAFLICLTVSVLPIGVQADQAVTQTWLAKSGLQTILPGHLVRLTIFEAGAATVSSRAVIELRDRANRLLARREANLTPNSPVQLDLKVAASAGPLQLRAVVSTTTDSGELTAPLVTFEDINPDLGITIKVDPPCGPGIGPSDPQALCPGWLEKTTPE